MLLVFLIIIFLTVGLMFPWKHILFDTLRLHQSRSEWQLVYIFWLYVSICISSWTAISVQIIHEKIFALLSVSFVYYYV